LALGQAAYLWTTAVPASHPPVQALEEQLSLDTQFPRPFLRPLSFRGDPPRYCRIVQGTASQTVSRFLGLIKELTEHAAVQFFRISCEHSLLRQFRVLQNAQ